MHCGRRSRPRACSDSRRRRLASQRVQLDALGVAGGSKSARASARVRTAPGTSPEGRCRRPVPTAWRARPSRHRDWCRTVGQVAAHLALVDHTSQAAGSRQHAQQRNFRQTDGAGAIVDQQDLIAGQRQLVAAAGGGAVQRGEKVRPSWRLESSMPLRVSLVNCRS